MSYNVIRTLYRLHRITANDVWSYVDDGVITAEQAVRICGPRPQQHNNV